MGVEVSKESDVYSYEILLLEMFTGRKPTDSIFIENFNLQNYAKMALPDRVMEIAGSLFLLEEEDAQRASQHNIEYGMGGECVYTPPVSFQKHKDMVSKLLSSTSLLFYILFHASFILLASNSTFGFANETDKQALLAIKDQIVEDPFQVFSSWNDSIHFCNWKGVTCGRRHQRVTILNLPSLKLVGSLSPHIGNLTFLKGNSFQGEFPTNLTDCSDIRDINISSNNLVGRIPIEVGSFSNLLLLDLSGNHFTGNIPPSLGNLSSLRVLLLDTNNLKGSIPFELGKLSNLQFLQLSSNNLSGMIPTPLYNISSIHIFALAGNQLSGSLSQELGLTLPKLQSFFLAINQFYGPIPPSLANISALVDFDSSVNFFRFLHLGGNYFGDVLPNSIANLSTKLNTLDITQNYISGSTPQGIENLINLKLLALDENMLTGSIPESIGKLSELEQLFIPGNNISGKVPPSIGNMSGLSILALGDNMLEGSIPVELGNCTNLQSLDLQLNHLTGAIPEQVIGLSSLTVGLFLNQNYLTGALPSQVGNLKNLGQLHISENKLSGEIPSTLGDCLVLEYLHMEGNLFKGTIPSSLQQLKGIQELNLSHNSLSGRIPSFLGELRMIEYLDLSYNKFEGEVPNKGVSMNVTAFSIVGNDNLCGGIKALQLPACPTQRARKLFAHKVYPTLSYAELQQATNEFSSANLIGAGSYGSVYKGILNSGEEIVTVKVFNLQLLGANKSFLAECEALRNIRHRNLVKIITSCSSMDFKGNDFKALVFEFMPNGTSESWLHPNQSVQRDPKSLNLIQRLNIAIDVASALDYLHHQCDTTAIHCDIKPSNVLLDNELCAHMGDFGLSRFLGGTRGKPNRSQSSSSIGITRTGGTIGYVSPGNFYHIIIA
ncbi:probable LRR receptor-like serine/threonine-protein kinase At3g47570 [Cornus florida]|uniref:probable LRR receptor-like serine/threonine-protein kinase At3g47570 n=1 Tax=Cornus florida TaxID=4283 RepID=UPI00289DF3DA|nr:probable LRR receptor-like serine/threonine-protein kinase At3g47570 [Cornus florida]